MKHSSKNPPQKNSRRSRQNGDVVFSFQSRGGRGVVGRCLREIRGDSDANIGTGETLAEGSDDGDGVGSRDSETKKNHAGCLGIEVPAQNQ